MLYTLHTLAGSTIVERATLLLNHILSSEPVAAERLRRHAGRCIRLQFVGWPGSLPALPTTAFRITPAGLAEWCGPDDAVEADLQVDIDAANPALLAARMLVGERPRVVVAGDAAFAADVDWLFDNLRWDVQDDLERIVGPAPARGLARLGRGIASGMRSAARRLGTLAEPVPVAAPATGGGPAAAEPLRR